MVDEGFAKIMGLPDQEALWRLRLEIFIKCHHHESVYGDNFKIFGKKIFMNQQNFTKIIKILDHKNLELYGNSTKCAKSY